MSLILEALRKSEAERRRGKVPDLHAERPPGALAARDGPPAWLWLALALATVVVLAVTLWFARTLLAAPPAVAGPEQALDLARAPAVASAGVSAEPAGRTEAPAGPLAAAVLPAPADSMPAPAIDQDRRVPLIAATTPIAPATADPPPRAAATAPEAPPPATTVTAGGTLAVPAPRAGTRPEQATDTVGAFAAVPADAAPAVATTAPAGSAPLRLGDLSTAERKQLPALKMSMHMWSPTQRFAIIDGVRVVEGDRVGEAVVEAITSNAVVLDWQGRRLQIPTR